MKNAKFILVFLFLLLLCSISHAQKSNNLSLFLGKLKSYTERHHIQLGETKPKMPIARPDSNRYSMPSPEVTGYMEDRETGLRFYMKYGKVIDPVTGYSFHVESGKIALEDAAALRDKFKLRK